MAEAPKSPDRALAPVKSVESRVQELTAENSRLRARNAELNAEQREHSKRLQELEAYNQLLQNLFVTTYRLHATLEPAELLDTLREILENLVGAEEFGLWDVGPDGDPGELLLESGLDEDTRDLSPAERALARGDARDDAWFKESVVVPPPGVSAIAVVPLKARSSAAGVLVIRKLLDHKPQLGKVDRQLLGVLAEQAGIALVASRLHSSKAAPP